MGLYAFSVNNAKSLHGSYIDRSCTWQIDYSGMLIVVARPQPPDAPLYREPLAQYQRLYNNRPALPIPFFLFGR